MSLDMFLERIQDIKKREAQMYDAQSQMQEFWGYSQKMNDGELEYLSLLGKYNSLAADKLRSDKMYLIKDILSEAGLLDRTALLRLVEQLEYEAYCNNPFPV